MSTPIFISGIGKQLKEVLGRKPVYERAPDTPQKRRRREPEPSIAERVAQLPASTVSEVLEAAGDRTRRDIEAALRAVKDLSKTAEEDQEKKEQDLTPRRNTPPFSTPTGGNPARPSNARMMLAQNRVERYAAGFPKFSASRMVREAQVALAMRQITGDLAKTASDNISTLYKRMLERRGECPGCHEAYHKCACPEGGRPEWPESAAAAMAEVDPGVKTAKITYPDAGENAPKPVQKVVERVNEEGGDPDTPLLYEVLGEGTPDYKMSKADADYRTEPVGDQKCGNCKFAFKKVVTGEFICSQVEGKIEPEHWCRLWEGRDQEKTAADDKAQATVEIKGSPGNVGATINLLNLIRAACSMGCSRLFKFDVDGDGPFYVDVEVKGRKGIPDDDELAETFGGDFDGDAVEPSMEGYGRFEKEAADKPFRRRVSEEQEKTAGEEREPKADNHPSAPGHKMRPRSELILFNRDGVYVIDKGDYLLFPGGGVDDGEQPRDAAIRETLEESNRHPINVQNAGTVEAVWPEDSGNEFWDDSEFDGERTYFFLGVDSGDAGVTHDDQENFELKPFNEVLERLDQLIKQEDQQWAKRNNQERRRLVANAKRMAKVRATLDPIKQAAHGDQVRHDDYQTEYLAEDRGSWTDHVNKDVHAVATEKPKTAPGSARSADSLTKAHKVRLKHTQTKSVEEQGKHKHASEQLLKDLKLAIKLAEGYTDHSMDPPMESLDRIRRAYNSYIGAKLAEETASFAPPPSPPPAADQPPVDQASVPAFNQQPQQETPETTLPSQERLAEGDPEFIAQDFVQQLAQQQQSPQQSSAAPQAPQQPAAGGQQMQVTAADNTPNGDETGVSNSDEIATQPATDDEREMLEELTDDQAPSLPVRPGMPGTSVNQPPPGVMGPTPNEQQQMASAQGAMPKAAEMRRRIQQKAAEDIQELLTTGDGSLLSEQDQAQNVQSEVFDSTPEASEQIEFAQEQPVMATRPQEERASTEGAGSLKQADTAQFKPLQQHILMTPEGKVVVRRLPHRRFAFPTQGPGRPAPYETEIPFVPESGIPEEGFHGYRIGLHVGESPEVPEGFETVDPTEALKDLYASMGMSANRPYRQLDRARARALVRYLKRQKRTQEEAAQHAA